MATSRATLARLLRDYYAGRIAGEVFRTAVYGMGVLLGYFKAEALADLDARAQALGERLDAMDARAASRSAGVLP